MEKARAIDILRKLITGAGDAWGAQYQSPIFEKWRRNTRLAIGRIFGEMSQHMQEFESINYWNPDHLGFPTIQRNDYQNGLAMAKALLESMSEEIQDYWGEERAELASPDTAQLPEPSPQTALKPQIFIGHGRSKLWARLQIFLKDELGLATITYETESRIGESIVPILEKMLDQASFAVLVLTAEDETSEGLKRARQNVIHEAGLFQGRLGFKKAVVIRQAGLEDFTNVAGLQYIGFSADRIEDSFYELQRVLKREKMLP